MIVKNSFFRAEITEKIFYARCAETHGVIDAMLKTNKARKAVDTIFKNIEGKTFLNIWDELRAVKGLDVNYKSY